MTEWELIKDQLRNQLSAESFSNWIQPTRSNGFLEGFLQISVPDEATKVILEEDYAPVLSAVVTDLGMPVRGFRFQVHHNGKAALPSAAVAPQTRIGSTHNPGAGALPATPTLIERYTFDNFVVGPCNQFAHAACHAVATKPSGSYNPLFLYGGTGIGKTHLMHAIGLALSRQAPGTRVVYTSSERFVNDMVTCIKQERMPSFQSHYRTADVLLVDDIHILAGKERTQEEFFHTFNDLYEHKKQIVISSDSAPKQIPGLVERLRSRFEWGLMVDMQPPDLETKMAILDKKAELEGASLPEDVRIFIATKTKSNVRELEGALVKVLAYSSLTGVPINLQMARQVLSGLADTGERKITIDAIQKAVATRFKLQQQQLRQKSNTHAIAYPRQIAMYLAKDLTSASLSEIGRAFGGKHHTTVLHSINKIEREREEDPNTNKLILTISDSLH